MAEGLNHEGRLTVIIEGSRRAERHGGILFSISASTIENTGGFQHFHSPWRPMPHPESLAMPITLQHLLAIR